MAYLDKVLRKDGAQGGMTDVLRKGVEDIVETKKQEALLEALGRVGSPQQTPADPLAGVEKVVGLATGLAGIDSQRSERLRQEAEAERRRAQELEQQVSVRQEGALSSTLELMRFLNESQSKQMETIAAMMKESRESTNALIMEIRRESKESVEREREERRRKEDEEKNRPASYFEQMGARYLDSITNRDPVQDLLAQKQVVDTLFPPAPPSNVTDLQVFSAKKQLEWEMDKWREERQLERDKMEHQSRNVEKLFQGIATIFGGNRSGGGDSGPPQTSGDPGFEPIRCYKCGTEWVMRPPFPEVMTCPNCQTQLVIAPEEGAAG